MVAKKLIIIFPFQDEREIEQDLLLGPADLVSYSVQQAFSFH
jgi:hypothetical protein